VKGTLKDSFSRKSEGYEEGFGEGHLSIAAPLGNLEGANLPRTLKD